MNRRLPETDDDFIYIAMERLACPEFLDQFRGCMKGQADCGCYRTCRTMLDVVQGKSAGDTEARNVN